jgi:hypothetical protein
MGGVKEPHPRKRGSEKKVVVEVAGGWHEADKTSGANVRRDAFGSAVAEVASKVFGLCLVSSRPPTPLSDTAVSSNPQHIVGI